MSGLSVYAIGLPGDTIDHVVAHTRLDAAAVWRQRTGASPSQVYREPIDSVVRECHSLAMVGTPATAVWEVLVDAHRGWL